ncbi:hypothetical protein GCM10010358_34730 [Streptomyces minutiscleroticus]|uniref:Uncharacterized protein n=1 Tax=Streptomyces minutiscleroticus TaxID=68238 RepID=A0A918KUK6_9ACTN|nr:hypothetical protein GCM10010358_34730 [Streptomyces minutiscleroticus]
MAADDRRDAGRALSRPFRVSVPDPDPDPASAPRRAHATTAARTHRTSGRWEASGRQLSPSSADAYTSPLRLPK